METNALAEKHMTTALPANMTAIRVAQFAGPEVIQVETLPIPEPTEDEVLVKIFAAGVGPWNGWIRSGRSVLPQPLPLTLGSDVSGIVVAVGSETTGFAVGEPVYGVTNKRFTGGYAQYAACRSAMLARKPASLSYIEAASAPVIAVTAWQMLFERANLSAGQRVLVHGAAGNVGRYAVQLARAAGLKVIATAFDKDIGELLTLGADDVIGPELIPNAKVDAVLDLVGGESQARLFDFISPGGMLVSAVSNPDQALASARGVAAEHALAVLLGKPAAEFTAGVSPLLESTLLPAIPAGMPSALLERRPDIAAAQRTMEASNQRIGVARAAMFPALNIGASGGGVGGALTEVFKWSSRSWVLGAMLSLPLIDGGRNKNNVIRSEAVLEESVARYRQSVLVAFSEVEDNLAGLRILSAQTEQSDAAVVSARRSAELAQKLYSAGRSSYPDLLDTQRNLAAVERNAVQLRGNRAVTTVALIRSLGGGWDAPPAG